MQFAAHAKHVAYSPYKLRPLANVIRGKGAIYALNWLTTYKTKRAIPIKKVLQSALANAKHLKNVDPQSLEIKEIRIDQGPILRYFKPGAMGRAMIQRRRQCHISIILESQNQEV
ncbi:MAG TPA: 50S ribosomal protein L22 [Candidatus Babeliaceae bacterium]|nr:50S ribosomal protein L22 [Candidatus Babeliaceae bacterium]